MNGYPPKISELSKYISNGCFTEALEILEEYGVTGSLACFLVAYLQVSEGWNA